MWTVTIDRICRNEDFVQDSLANIGVGFKLALPDIFISAGEELTVSAGEELTVDKKLRKG